MKMRPEGWGKPSRYNDERFLSLCCSSWACPSLPLWRQALALRYSRFLYSPRELHDISRLLGLCRYLRNCISLGNRLYNLNRFCRCMSDLLWGYRVRINDLLRLHIILIIIICFNSCLRSVSNPPSFLSYFQRSFSPLDSEFALQDLQL